MLSSVHIQSGRGLEERHTFVEVLGDVLTKDEQFAREVFCVTVASFRGD